MSLADARHSLHWNVILAALTEAGVDAEVLKTAENARDAHNVFRSMTNVLLGTADAKQVKNYVKVEVRGSMAPFERVYLELTKPGGKTSHELREMLRDRLATVRHHLTGGPPTDAFREGIIQGIDETLAAESPVEAMRDASEKEW